MLTTMEIGIFIAGIVCGIVALAFFILMNNCHRVFHEIEWHDAQREKPSLYVDDAVEPHSIRVLVHSKKGVITDDWYYPDLDKYDFFANHEVTHFAYIEEVKQTVPPCPVCTASAYDSPYAVPTTL